MSVQDQWYFVESGLAGDETKGPLTTEQMIALAIKGKIKSKTRINKAGTNAWYELRQIKQLVSAIQNEKNLEKQRIEEAARIEAEKKRQDAALREQERLEQERLNEIARQEKVEAQLQQLDVRQQIRTQTFRTRKYPALMTIAFICYLMAGTIALTLVANLVAFGFANFTFSQPIDTGALVFDMPDDTDHSSTDQASEAPSIDWFGFAWRMVLGSMVLLMVHGIPIILMVAVAELIRLAVDVQANTEKAAYYTEKQIPRFEPD